MSKCVACNKQVPDGQSRCPHCGAEVRLPIVATARRATPARVTDTRDTPSLNQTRTWTRSSNPEMALPATRPKQNNLLWLWLVLGGLVVAVTIVLLLPAERTLNENGYLELRILGAENIGRGMPVDEAVAEALLLSGVEADELADFEESLDVATRSRLERQLERQLQRVYSFTSQPAGAGFVIDGQEYSSPAQTTLRIGERYQLSCSRSGYEPREFEFLASPDDSQIVVQLERLSFPLSLNSQPVGAQLSLNCLSSPTEISEEELELPATVRLVVGERYRLEVRRAGYHTWSTEITPQTATDLDRIPTIIELEKIVTELTCPECRTSNPLNATYCRECGTSLGVR